MGGARGLSCPRFVHCREETPLKHTTRKRAWLGAKAIEWESKCSPCTCAPWMAAASAGTSGPRSAGSSTRGGRTLPLAGHCSDLRASYSTRCACLFVQGLRHEVCNRNRNPSLPPGLHPSGRSIHFVQLERGGERPSSSSSSSGVTFSLLPCGSCRRPSFAPPPSPLYSC